MPMISMEHIKRHWSLLGKWCRQGVEYCAVAWVVAVLSAAVLTIVALLVVSQQTWPECMDMHSDNSFLCWREQDDCGYCITKLYFHYRFENISYDDCLVTYGLSRTVCWSVAYLNYNLLPVLGGMEFYALRWGLFDYVPGRYADSVTRELDRIGGPNDRSVLQGLLLGNHNLRTAYSGDSVDGIIRQHWREYTRRDCKCNERHGEEGK